MQRQNRSLPLLVFLSVTCIINIFLPSQSRSDIVFYEPDIDISMGVFDYNLGRNPPLNSVQTGFYLGGYLGIKSPLFTNLFNAKKINTVYESGIALNRVRDSNYYYISIPFLIDFGYRVQISRKITILPFLGMGYILNYWKGYSSPFSFHSLFDVGLEFKRSIWEKTLLKVKVNYGVVFDRHFESGYSQFLKIKFPVPFIP